MSGRADGDRAPARSTVGGRPLVVACLRHVDTHPAVDPLTGRTDRDVHRTGPAPGEWAALELALQVAQAWDGDVLAVCAGPVDAERTLRQAAAVGVGVLRVAVDAVTAGHAPAGAPREDPLEPLDRYLDELAGSGARTAIALARAIGGIGDPALVICGDRSADRGTGAVPAYLAAELGVAQALGVVRLEIGEGELLAERRLDRGRRERVRITGRAVISVEAGGIRLRRATLPDLLAAQDAPVPCVAPEVPDQVLTRGTARPLRPRTRVVPPPTGASARERLLALTGALEERTPPTVLHPSGPAEAAELLLEYLGRHGYLPTGGDGGEGREGREGGAVAG